MATSSQDVSRSGDHADTATTTPEPTVPANVVGGPVNQTPSSSTSSAPSNLYQLNPVSDSVADGTSGDISSTTSSLNAAQLDQLNPPATSTSSRLSQTADGAQLPSTNFGNFGATTQYGAFIGSDPQLARTPSPVSAFDAFQNLVLSGNGDRQPSIQGVSSQASAMMNTLESNLNIPQNGAVSIGSVLPADRNGRLAPTIQSVSSQPNMLVNTLGPNLNIPQTSGLDPILPAGMLSGNGDLATSIQGVSTKTNAMVNALSNLNIPQNGAVSIGSVLPADGNGRLAPSIEGVSSQANTLVNTLGPNLNTPQTSGLDPPASMLSENGDLATSIQGVATKANTMVNTKESNLNIPQNVVVSIGSVLPADGNGHLAPSIEGLSSQASTSVNTSGPNLNIPQTSGLDSPDSTLSGNGDLATSIQGVSTKANTVVNTLESIPQNGAESIGSAGTLGPNLNIPQNDAVTNIPLPGSIGTDIVGISTIPMSSLTSPVQAASNTIPDPSRQSSFTNNFPDSSNTPRISNGVETSPPSDHTEANTATTTGNCICNL